MNQSIKEIKEFSNGINNRFMLFIVLLFLFPPMASSQIIQVKQDSTGDYTKIQDAINFAQSGDTVLVWPGIYYENLEIIGKQITLASLLLTSGDENYKYSTIIDGNDSANCIKVREITDTCSIVGFTIKNGIGNLFYSGGGIHIFESDVKIINNIVYNNKSRYAGGIGCTNDSYAYLSSNIIYNNHAYSKGGGMYIAVNSYVDFDSINRNSIFYNFSTRGCDICISKTNNNPVDIFLDTCSVSNPISFFISVMDESGYELNSCNVEIINSKIAPFDGDLFVNPKTGDNNNTGTSPENPLKSIAWAYHKIKVDSLEKNTIHLANGIYSDTTNDEKFPLNIRPFINVIGQSRDSVILDGNRRSSILKGNNCISDYSFKNMTLQRNQIPTYEPWEQRNTLAFLYRQNHRFILDSIVFKDSYAKNAQAILSYYAADSSIVRNCTFTDNKGGYGLRTVNGSYSIVDDSCFCGYGDVQFIQNSIFNKHQPDYNNSEYPVGITLSTGDNGINIITNSLFTNNTYMAFNQADFVGTTYMLNCTFVNNSEINEIPAIQASDGNINMYNCITYNNHDIPFMLGASTPQFNFHSHLKIYNSLIENGEESVFFAPSCYHDDTVWCHLYYDSTNIDADPMFLGMWNDPYMISDGSPCIDAGTLANLPDFIELPEYDLAGNPRVVGDSIDMGAYEWNPTIVGFHDIGQDGDMNKNTLLKVSPNPFRENTKIEFFGFQSAKSGHPKTNFKVEIYDNYGRLVRNILSSTLLQDQKIHWQGDDNNGNLLPAGIYNVVLFSGDKEIESLKLVKQ